jgi:DNA-binding transcriptional LysR family regulator
MDLNQTLVFTRVVQTGSFTAAAKLLGLPKSSVSRRVTLLEERLGARLLQRTTRKLGLTEEGRLYFERAERLVAALAEADAAVGQLKATPQGRLRVTAPLSFGMLGPIVAEYLEAWPEVQVEVVCTDRRVDLVDEGFDVAVRAGPLQDSTLIARPLGTIRTILVTGPALLKQRGAPKTPADLARLPCIAFGSSATPELWALESGEKKAQVQIAPRLTVNVFELMFDSACESVGIAAIPDYLCTEQLAKGRLVRVLPKWSGAELPVHAVYPSTRQLSPRVVEFVGLLRQRLALGRASR